MVTCAEVTNSYKEMIKARIAEEAAEVRERLRGGRFFGQPIDPGNTDMMIAAAYHLGYSEGLGIRWEGYGVSDEPR